jgi:hypothetical protein
MHITNQFMNMSILVPQVTTAEYEPQQETLVEPDLDITDDSNQTFETSQPKQQDPTFPGLILDLNEDLNQGIGIGSQTRLQVIRPVHTTSPRPIIQIEIKKRSSSLTAYLTDRTRKNKKPPEGNNSFGRKGTLACEQCRKRKSKVFAH